MADRKKSVLVEYLADTSKFRKGTKAVADEADKTGGRFQKMGATVKAGIALGAGAAVAFLKDATENALADAAAQGQLELAVKNATTASDLEVEALGDYIDKTQAATGITDDQLRPAFANLVRATGDVEEAQRHMTTAMDIATARGLPLEAVTLAIAKAAQGNIGALGRMGLKTRDAAGDFVTFEEAMKQAQETFGGATDEFANSAEGKMARVKIAFDEAAEGIGAALIPIVEGVADVFTNLEKIGDQNFLDAVLTDLVAIGDEEKNRENNPGIQMMIDSFEALFNMVGINTEPAIRSIGPAAQAAMEEVIPALDAAEGGADDLTGAVQDSTDAFYDHQDAVRALYDPTFALVDANQNLADAQADVTALEKDHKEGTPEYIAALAKVREEFYRVEGAERAVAEQAPVTATAMRKHLESTGKFTAAQMDIIIAELERWNAFRPRNPFAGAPIGFRRPGGPQEHTGGTIQGDYRGQEVLFRGRAGEHVSQGGRPTGGHDGGPMVIQFNVDGRKLFEQVVLPEQVKYNKRNGRPV